MIMFHRMQMIFPNADIIDKVGSAGRSDRSEVR